MITITTDLDIISSGVMPVIHLSQYDSDFSLVFNIFASRGTFTMPSGTTAEIRGTKTDGNGYDAAGTVSGTTVTITGDEQMTAVAGRNIYEIALYYNNKRLNTINFVLDVEHAALDADTITSESVLRELDAIVESAEISTAAAATATAAAAEAESAMETIEAIGVNLPDVVKTALLNCFENVAWATDNGQAYYDDLVTALSEKIPSYITAAYTQGSETIYTDDDIEDFRTDLIVTAYFDDNTSAVVENYTLSGTLEAGTSTITVTYRSKTATFSVTDVVDFYNIYEWDFANAGELKMVRKESAAVAIDYGSAAGTYRYRPATNAATSRASFNVLKGKTGTQVLHLDGTDTSPLLYLIPVPEEATSISCVITPSEQYFALRRWAYDGEGKWRSLKNGSWMQGSGTDTFTAGADQYFSINCKPTSDGNTDYDSQTRPYPSIKITFE